MPTTFQARFLLPPAGELPLSDLEKTDFRRRRDLPDVLAETAQEAAELARPVVRGGGFRGCGR